MVLAPLSDDFQGYAAVSPTAAGTTDWPFFASRLRVDGAVSSLDLTETALPGQERRAVELGRADMAVSVTEFLRAQAATEAERAKGYAVAARYDRHRRRLVLRLSTKVELSVPVWLLPGLAAASPEALSQIEITPSGLGLHWPRLDADLFVPALKDGVFGSKA